VDKSRDAFIKIINYNRRGGANANANANAKQMGPEKGDIDSISIKQTWMELTSN
jgi:hypothetical protein